MEPMGSEHDLTPALRLVSLDCDSAQALHQRLPVLNSRHPGLVPGSCLKVVDVSVRKDRCGMHLNHMNERYCEHLY